MGEYVCTTIKLGGRITAAQADELIELLDNYDFYDSSKLAGESEEGLARDDLNANLYANEVNYGQIADVTAWCREHYVSYEHWVDACSGEGEDIRRWSAEDGVERTRGSSGGYPVWTLSEILDVEALSTGLATLIEAVRWWKRELVLEIVG